MILFAADCGDARLEEAGGKAASLLRLRSHGFPVPPFFVIPAGATRGGTISAQLREAVREAWLSLGGEAHEYAVRSSGVAEDSADNSFAGVFDTVLHVRGFDGIIAAIEKCLASHNSAAAQTYRNDRTVVDDDAMAVIVQRMVNASWSGVSFTADPASQSLSVMVVNAVEGVGEKLVSGLVNPEEIKIANATGRVISRHAPPGQKPFPESLLRAVIAESQRAADVFGFPQDLEWAFDSSALQLLQSRPITTLTGVWHNRALEPWAENPKADPDNSDKIWTRAYADEIWAPPVSPLFYDVQNLTAQIPSQLSMYGDMAPGPPDAFKYYRAAPYLDISLLERLYVFLPRVARLPGLLYQLPPERRDAVRNARWQWRGLLRRTWIFEVRNGARWGFTRNHKFLKRSWAPFLADTYRLGEARLDALDEAGLDAHIQSIWALAGTIGFECGITVFYYAQDLKLLITGLLGKWFGKGEELYATVSAGLDDSHTVRETDNIWQLADMIRNAGADVLALAKTSTWAEFELRSAPETFARVQAAFDEFLKNHAHRGANYKDLIHPRWGDDPQLLWLQIQAFLGDDIPRPADSHARSAALRLATQRQCLNDVRGITAPAKRWLLRKLFRYNEIYMSLRDNHRFYYDRIWWLLRCSYLEKGRRLAAKNLLTEVKDIVFLVRTEIAQLEAGTLSGAEAAARIALRREEWVKTRQEQPPKFLRQGYVGDDEPLGVGATARKLVGMAASAGRVSGRARVIFDVADLGSVGRGDILVTRQTDPSWTPAFARLAGLVLETGGVLAHGASLCREFNVPCVTVVEQATRLIRDGDLIVINGGLGTVEIIDESGETSDRAA